MHEKKIYALDFDGVICDSVKETAITGWNSAQVVWPELAGESVNKAFIHSFRQVRPKIETGYEAILVMRLLQQGISPSRLQADYERYTANLIGSDNLSIRQLKQVFSESRDEWMRRDYSGWIAINPLFSGIAESLDRLKNKLWYIITTKQEKFVKHILEQNHIQISDERLYGLDRQMNKQQVLRQLVAKHANDQIVFVEDRLETLLSVADNPDLQSVQLELADWGFNTTEERAGIKQARIQCIGIEQFISG